MHPETTLKPTTTKEVVESNTGLTTSGTAVVAQRKSAGVPVPNTHSRRGKTGFIGLFTDVLGSAIVQNVKAGAPIPIAAGLNRVPAATVANWLEEGEADPNGKYGVFAADIRQAQGEFVMEAIEGIKDAGLSDAKQWTALMTLLERIYPEFFRRPDAKNGPDITINIGRFDQVVQEAHEQKQLSYGGG